MPWEMSHKLYMKYQDSQTNKYHTGVRPSKPEVFLWHKFTTKYPQYHFNGIWTSQLKNMAVTLSNKYDWVNDCPTNELLILLATEKI